MQTAGDVHYGRFPLFVYTACFEIKRIDKQYRGRRHLYCSGCVAAKMHPGKNLNLRIVPKSIDKTITICYNSEQCHKKLFRNYFELCAGFRRISNVSYICKLEKS